MVNGFGEWGMCRGGRVWSLSRRGCCLSPAVYQVAQATARMIGVGAQRNKAAVTPVNPFIGHFRLS